MEIQVLTSVPDTWTLDKIDQNDMQMATEMKFLTENRYTILHSKRIYI